MTAPLTGTFDTVKGHNTRLVRKMLEMAIFIAPDTAPVIEDIVDDTNALIIPEGYRSVGIMSKEEGASITPELDVSETSGYGYGQPIRRDTVSRLNGIGFTMLESRRSVWELYYGIDLSAVKAPAGTKNQIKWEHPDRPDTKYWRVLCLGRDGQGSRAIYHGEHFPRLTLSDVGAQVFSETEPLGWPVTLGADTDTEAGFPQSSFWAGPGLTTQLITDMGFARATV